MAESTTKLVFEGEVGKAILGITKIIEKMKEAKGEVKDFGKVSKETDVLGDSINKAAGSVKNFITGFATIGGVVAAVKGLVGQLNEIVNLRREFYQTGLTVEQLALKIANLRKDVTTAGIGTAVKDIESVSRKTGVSMDVAAKTLFYSESGMGTGPAATSAAINIAQFAGPGGLTPEEVKMVPKLFSVMKANTAELQNKVLNQIFEATAGSIAETGEFLEPFISTVVSDIERGFTLPQSLARMTAAIETTGSIAEAATASSKVVDVLAGRTDESLKFMKGQAKKRGLDFSAMTDPQRFEFGRSLYQEYQATPQKLDTLKTQLDTRGFQFMRALFSETGQRKYFEMLPKIESSGGTDFVGIMAQQYMNTLSAKASQAEASKQVASYEIGKKFSGSKLLSDITEETFKEKHAAMGWWGSIGAAMVPDSVEKKKISDEIIRQNMVMAYERAGGESQKENIQKLYSEFLSTQSMTMNPKLVEQIAGVTDNFQLQRITGRRISPALFTETVRSGPVMAGGSITERNRNLSEIAADDLKANTTATQENTKTMTQTIDANTRAIKQLTDTLRYNSGGITPAAIPPEH